MCVAGARHAGGAAGASGVRVLPGAITVRMPWPGRVDYGPEALVRPGRVDRSPDALARPGRVDAGPEPLARPGRIDGGPEPLTPPASKGPRVLNRRRQRGRR
ncbi:protein of unknown function [Burkholderia multivorans]